MPSLSNDLIRRPDQIGVITLGCLKGSLGPLKVTWPVWHSIFTKCTKQGGKGEHFSSNDGRREAELCLTAKQTFPQRQAAGWWLIRLGGPQHAGMPSCVSPKRWSPKEQQNAESRRDISTCLREKSSRGSGEVWGCGGESSKVPLVTFGMLCRARAGNISSHFKFSLEINNHLNVCRRKTQKTKKKKSPAAGVGSLTGLMVWKHTYASLIRNALSLHKQIESLYLLYDVYFMRWGFKMMAAFNKTLPKSTKNKM